MDLIPGILDGAGALLPAWVLLGGVISLFIVLHVLALLRRRKLSNEGMPYQAMALLTDGERAFYDVLRQAVAADEVILAKVRLADLIDVQPGTPDGRRHFNRIMAKHIDFVICETASLKVRKLVELDDRSHLRRDRHERDRFVDAAVEAAGLHLVHVTAQRSYRADDLRHLLAGSSSGVPASAALSGAPI